MKDTLPAVKTVAGQSCQFTESSKESNSSTNRNMNKNQISCHDCSVAMQPIKLVDATDRSLDQKGTAHVELGYAAAESKAGFFTNRIPIIGSVRGMICPSCGQIKLHGVGKV
jgi:hypothetical protein